MYNLVRLVALSLLTVFAGQFPTLPTCALGLVYDKEQCVGHKLVYKIGTKGTSVRSDMVRT